MRRKLIYPPQYGLGSWLQENAGTVGAVAGGLVGGPLGASIGGGIGGVIQGGYDKQQQNQSIKAQQALLNKQSFINSYNSNPSANPIQYANNFANGGNMEADIANSRAFGIKRGYVSKDGNSYIVPKGKTWQDVEKLHLSEYNKFKHSSDPFTVSNKMVLDKSTLMQVPNRTPGASRTTRGSLLNSFPNSPKLNSYSCGGKMSNGGLLNSTSGIDGITIYPASAGTHESSKTGGIPIGKYGTTEGNEVRVGKYVFSNRF